MTQSFNPSNWFWILVGLLVCCLISLSSSKQTNNMSSVVQHASSAVMSVVK